jgi:hypothetical protein
MEYKIDYLLKYLSNDTFKRIEQNKANYILEDLEHNRVSVDLNIRYLIKYGITNIDKVIYDWVEELLLPHNEFITKVNKYEKSLGRDGFIDMIENA